jgi:DNA replication protein DnaC
MPDCPICNDTGWKPVTAAPDAATSSASPKPPRATRVTRCDCQTRNRGSRLMQMAHIPNRYEHCEISNFDVLSGRFEMSMHKAKIFAEGFVRDFPLDNNQGLLFTGTIGTGKTHLAVAIMKELIRTRGIPCRFYDYRELLKQIQNSYNPQVQATEAEVLRPVMETDVIVLDELGAIRSSEWVSDTVSHILNTRYNNQKTTIITTNLADEPPAGGGDETDAAAARRATREATLGDRITERMRSRLHEMCRKVEMQGEDYRTKYRSASFR